MSVAEDIGSLETGLVNDLLELLSNSERQILLESLHQCLPLETSGEMLVEPDFSYLHGMKDGNERARQSGNKGICYGASMISNSPGGMELQPINEDESLFSDLAQKDFYFVEDSHNYQLLQSHGMISEVNDTQLFCADLVPSQTAANPSPEAFERYHPVEMVAVDDWGSTSVHAIEVGSPPGEAEPTQSCPAMGSPGLMFLFDSVPSNGFVASRLSIHPSKTTVPNEEISSAAVNQIQVVKTECLEEWPSSEVSEGELDVKKERRRQQNRTAARKCRNRKKETFEMMFKAAQKAKQDNVLLQKAVLHLRQQLNSVMEEVKLHQLHCGLQMTLSQLRSPVSKSPR